ncbi:MAG: hypothetical protein JF625_23575 [Inquilinus limosus]|uniref:Uncharacterized protein n=1 Tax=Inquilinus limosus TaxID=171674 RepID=A0A952FPK3_9PROT|nr:hypothetical protein [Inquilinus limosus]
MDSNTAAFVRNCVVVSALALMSCRGDIPPNAPVAEPPAAAAPGSPASVGIPEACRSKMEAIVASSQRIWDKLIDNQRTEADEARHRDFVDATVVSYADAGCKSQPMADLGNCIAFGRPQAGLTKQGNVSLHARCLEAAEANY